MNRILVIMILAATMLLSFNACKVENDDEAKLQVYVERNDQSVYNAMVRLYLSEADFKAQGDNFVNGKATDLVGGALFSGLPEKQYYIGVTYETTYENYDNFTGIYQLDAPTQLGKTTTITIDLNLSTDLELTVVDKQGNVISGAVVKLYGSEDDAIAGTNVIGDALTTAITGKVTFNHLFVQAYYFSVTKDDLTLYFSTNVLTPNAVSNYFATVDPYAYLNVTVVDKTTTNPISSASVKLFTSEAAWIASTPHYGTPQFSDDNGQAYFAELEPQEYWVEALFGALSNNNGDDAALGMLDAGVEYDVTVRISSGKGDKLPKPIVEMNSKPKFVPAKLVVE